MVAGLMKKVRQSGEIASWEVAAVYEKDAFERLLGDDQRIYHKPYEESDPGKVIGAYSIVTFKDGTKSRDYLPRWRIEKARAQGMAKDSLMWSQFYDEGAIKTVVKHHSKRLPMSTDVEAIFERDETMAHVGDGGEIHSETPAPLSRLDAIEHQIEADEPEVITEQAEEVEAVIEEEAGFSLADEIAEHPGEAKADEIIAEIREKISVMDINSLMSRSKPDLAAMLEEDRERVAKVADECIETIKAEQAQAKESEGAE